MSSEEMEKIVKLYRKLAQCPSLSSAKLLRKSESHLIVESKWSQRNLERTTNQKFAITHYLNGDHEVLTQTTPTDITSELASKTAPSKDLKAILRSAPGKDKDSTSKQYIEIWSQQCLLKNYDLSAIDVHGEVYTDSEFGSFEWSPDATKILYIAEKKLPKSEPFYKQKPQDKKPSDKPQEDVTSGNEYVYKPDWGEQLVGKHLQVIVVLDTNEDKITIVPGLDESLSPGQVLWTPEGDGIVGVAWKHEPRYLGLIACTNRESWIFYIKGTEFLKLTPDKRCVRSPRFSPDGKRLIYLERELNGPHHNVHSLMSIDWQTIQKTPTEIIRAVKTYIPINNQTIKFYGLYNRTLPTRCFSSDSKLLFFSTPQRYNIMSYVLNFETGVLNQIRHDSTSLMVLDVFDDTILWLNTSVIMPSRLMISKLNKNEDEVELKAITEPMVIDELKDIIYENNEYVYSDGPVEDVKDFNFMYYGPKEGKEKSVPVILAAHGGPHASYANTFIFNHAIVVASGYAMIQVNYRGSTGMGSDNVEYLQGRVGDTDVKDCVKACEQALTKYKWLDDARIGLSGGSHGGFLVAHLSGQYPDMFKAVVSRNPVIDIAAMFTISDIPDWCAASTGQSYDDMSANETSEMVVKMFQCSPIVHAHKVKAPTLMLIGKNDLRVPSSQGKHWYHRLKANGVKTKMMVYDDCHPLSSGPVEIDEIINGLLWFNEHVKGTFN